MQREEIVRLFENLKLWTRRGERAPHKPLLVLYAIRRFFRDGTRLIPYSEIDGILGRLLQQFAPRGSKKGAHYPFWRLQEDDVWEVTPAGQIGLTSSGDAKVTDLRLHNASGGFREDIFREFQRDTGLAFEILSRVLYKHFPVTIHEDIILEIGFDIPIRPIVIGYPVQISTKRRRDPKFRPQILELYKFRCAVCSFDAQLRSSHIALDAAHIKWHTHDGPDEPVNGLALCSLHHKLFDRGAFTLSKARKILVSRDVKGSVGFDDWLMNFHGKPINLPDQKANYPSDEFISWHDGAVFKGNYHEL